MKRLLLAAAAFALCAVGIAQAVQITGTDSSNRRMVVRMGFEHVSVTDSIVAFAGGGQSNAVQLDSAYNRVITVATGNDSVKLPSCQTGLSNTGVSNPAVPTGNSVGLIVWVTNAAAANSLNIFPQPSQSINALSANAAYAMAANKTSQFICGTNGIWYSNLGA